MDPCFATASGLARAIRNGKLTSREATEAHLERIARLNGPIDALVVVDREGAMKGLPIGLQLTGKRWSEAKLLGVAKVLEKLLPPCPVPPAYA